MLPLSSVDLTEINVEDLEIKGECLARFQLGQGAIADIFHVFYKGHDAVLKRPRNNYTDQEKIEIRREARVVAALNNCENVVRIYGICDTMPFNGIIMEYCAGPNLSELVFKLYESRVEMETIRIFKWCHELSKTLCELNVTYFHGDVKTENVIVKERPCYCQNGVYKDVTIRDTTYHLCQACHGVHLEHLSLKFCDFGKSYEHGTKERNFGGTAEFAAPETIQRGEYTQKSEVYTFGHLMLILVIGFPTDQCADGQRRFLQLYNNKKYDLSGCKSNSICEIISWCLDKNAENRPTFKQLLEKLNSRFDHYKSLRGDDKKSAAHIANIEREEFLEHYKIPRKITMGHRTVTTSTFLSISTYSSNSQLDLSATYYGGPLDNDVFEETPLPSPSTSRKFNDGYELARSFVENTLYTGDEENIIMLPTRRRKGSFIRRNILFKYLVQAKNLISAKITTLARRGRY